MILIRYLTLFLFLTAIGVLYDKYKKKYDLDGNLKNHSLIEKYLLNDDSLLSGKPILWIHNDRGINQRDWISFQSRNTNNVNQPYIMLCLKSIIQHCGKSFNICLIDDDSFSKLIPNWSLSISKIPEPQKSHVRKLATVKLLYYYGGMSIPNSTLVLKDLSSIYDENI